MKVAQILALLVCFAGSSTLARADDCESPAPDPAIPAETALSLSEIQARLDGPFVEVCREQYLAEAPLDKMYLQLLSTDAKGRKLRDFLRMFLKDVQLVHQMNTNLAKNLELCMGEQKGIDQCQPLRKYVDSVFRKKVRDARYHLSLSSTMMAGNPVLPDLFVNEPMQALGIFKEKDWDGLSAQELRVAKSVLASYREKINKKRDLSRSMAEIDKQNRALRAEFTGLREEHLKHYKNILNAYPLMQFIHSGSASDDEIKQASLKMQESLAKENKLLSSIEASLAKEGDDTTAEERSLLDYTGLAFGTLQRNPQYCRIVSAAVATGNQRQKAMNFAFFPVMGISAFVSSVVSVPLLIGAGSFFLYQDQAQFSSSRQRMLSEAEFAGYGVSAEELAMAEGARNLNLAFMAPLGGVRKLGRAARSIRAGKLGAEEAIASRVPAAAYREIFQAH